MTYYVSSTSFSGRILGTGAPWGRLHFGSSCRPTPAPGRVRLAFVGAYSLHRQLWLVGQFERLFFSNAGDVKYFPARPGAGASFSPENFAVCIPASSFFTT